jgi:hypothetical protein
MPLPYDEDDLELDDTGDFLVGDTGEDADDVDAWVREHVTAHGPTAEGFRLLGDWDEDGDFV